MLPVYRDKLQGATPTAKSGMISPRTRIMSEVIGFSRSSKTPSNLMDLALENLTKRGLTLEDMAPLNMVIMPQGNDLKAMVGNTPWGCIGLGAVGAMVFELEPATNSRPAELQGRLIIDPDRVTAPKPGEKPGKLKTKYCRPTGSSNVLFIPPHLTGWTDPKNEYDLLIVEGAFNAVRHAKEGFRAVAIPGVNNYRIRGKGSDVIPSLTKLVQAPNVRKVIVAFDSDTSDLESNPGLWAAKNIFLQDLLKIRRDRTNTIYVVSPPPNSDGSKCGPDDYLHAYGRDLYEALLREAKPYSDDPYFKIQTAILDRFIQDESNNTFFDTKQRTAVTPAAANIIMSGMGSVLDITSNRPKIITFDVDRFMQIGPEVGRRIATGRKYDPSNDEVYIWDEDCNPPMWKINEHDPRDIPKPIKGDLTLFHRMCESICRDTPEAIHKILTIAAYHAQNPTLTPKYAIFLYGDKGSGKSNFTKLCCRALNLKFSDAKVTVGKDGEGFNAPWRGFAGREWAEVDRHMDPEWVKALITSETYIHNDKNQRAYPRNNHTMNWFTSNSARSVIQPGDRRFIICGKSRADNKELGLEFERALGTTAHPGLLINYLRYFLLNYDASGYHTMDVHTSIRDEIINASKTHHQTIYDEVMEIFEDIEGFEAVPNNILRGVLETFHTTPEIFNKENADKFVTPFRPSVKVNGTPIRFKAFKNLDKWKVEDDTAKYLKQYDIAVKGLLKTTKY